MLAFIHTVLSFCIIAVLAIAAVSDLKARIISNRLVLCLVPVALGMMALRLSAGTPVMTALVWPMITTLSVFAVGLILFARGMMGGGDVKLITTLALCLPAASVLPFLFLMAIIGGVVAMLTAIAAAFQKSWLQLAEIETGFSPACTASHTIVQVPYGVAIAAAGVAVVAMPLVA